MIQLLKLGLLILISITFIQATQLQNQCLNIKPIYRLIANNLNMNPMPGFLRPSSTISSQKGKRIKGELLASYTNLNSAELVKAIQGSHTRRMRNFATLPLIADVKSRSNNERNTLILPRKKHVIHHYIDHDLKICFFTIEHATMPTAPFEDFALKYLADNRIIDTVNEKQFDSHRTLSKFFWKGKHEPSNDKHYKMIDNYAKNMILNIIPSDYISIISTTSNTTNAIKIGGLLTWALIKNQLELKPSSPLKSNKLIDLSNPDIISQKFQFLVYDPLAHNVFGEVCHYWIGRRLLKYISPFAYQKYQLDQLGSLEHHQIQPMVLSEMVFKDLMIPTLFLTFLCMGEKNSLENLNLTKFESQTLHGVTNMFFAQYLSEEARNNFRLLFGDVELPNLDVAEGILKKSNPNAMFEMDPNDVLKNSLLPTKNDWRSKLFDFNAKLDLLHRPDEDSNSKGIIDRFNF